MAVGNSRAVLPDLVFVMFLWSRGSIESETGAVSAKVEHNPSRAFELHLCSNQSCETIAASSEGERIYCEAGTTLQ